MCLMSGDFMNNRRFCLSVFLLGLSAVGAGCATTRPRQAEQTDTANQAQELRSQLEAKDQEIQDLQNQLDSSKRMLQTDFVGGVRRNPHSKSRIPGVSVADIQRALVRAGLDPGPVDGHNGRKTKSAVKEFQRKNHLKADGVVGEKTWALLKS